MFRTSLAVPTFEHLVQLTGCDCAESFDAKSVDVANLFRSHINARNMSLVLAGPKANVDRAMALATQLQSIPAGDGSAGTPKTYGEVLRGRIKSLEHVLWVIGLRVSAPPEADPAAACFFYEALLHRLNDDLSYRQGLAYALPGYLFLGRGEQVMVFEPYVDEDVVDYKKIAKEVKRVTAEMATACAWPWWRTYTEAGRRTFSRFWMEPSDASLAADEVADRMIFARMAGREEIGVRGWHDWTLG